MILADSGFWLGLASTSDTWHERAVAAAERWAGETLVTTWPVVAETVHLIGERLNPAHRIRFMEDLVNGACEIHALDASALPRLHQLMVKYRDRPMDLADASLVVLAEQLNEGRILTGDLEDFSVYRWGKAKPFQNLLMLT